MKTYGHLEPKAFLLRRDTLLKRLQREKPRIGDRVYFAGLPHTFEAVRNPIRRLMGTVWELRWLKIDLSEKDKFGVITDWSGPFFGSWHLGFEDEEWVEITTEDNRFSYWGSWSNCRKLGAK